MPQKTSSVGHPPTSLISFLAFFLGGGDFIYYFMCLSAYLNGRLCATFHTMPKETRKWCQIPQGLGLQTVVSR